MKAKAILHEGFRSFVDNERGHSIVTDLPKESNGENTGASALEIAVMGYAGCVSTIYKVVAKKMKLNIERIEVEMEAQKGDETINKIDMTVKIKSPDSEKKLEKCLEQTCKTCPVGVLFIKAGVEVNKKIIVEQ